MNFGQTSRAPSTSATRPTQWVQPGPGAEAAPETGSTQLAVRDDWGNELGVSCEVSCGLENWFIGPVLGSQMVIFLLMAFLFAEGGRKIIWKFKNWRMSCDADAFCFTFHSVAQVFLSEILWFFCVRAQDDHLLLYCLYQWAKNLEEFFKRCMPGHLCPMALDSPVL